MGFGDYVKNSLLNPWPYEYFMIEAHLVYVPGYTKNPVPGLWLEMESMNTTTTAVFEAWAYNCLVANSNLKGFQQPLRNNNILSPAHLWQICCLPSVIHTGALKYSPSLFTFTGQPLSALGVRAVGKVAKKVRRRNASPSQMSLKME